MEKFVLVHRDGVIGVRKDEPICTPEDFILLPFVQEAMFNLREMGFKVIVLVTEPALQNGQMDQAAMDGIHDRMISMIESTDGKIQDVLVCPSALAPWEKCALPKPGLLQIAAYKYKFDLSRTYFVGDRLECLQAAWKVGCKSAFVKSGKPFKTIQYLKQNRERPDIMAQDLLGFVTKYREQLNAPALN